MDHFLLPQHHLQYEYQCHAIFHLQLNHQVQYKDYPLKLRVARGTGLPHDWDDLPTYVYDVAKSWKHNSKRAHQYYKEHEQK